MKLTEFSFNLPTNLIAQKPASPRDTCKLLVLDRINQTITDDSFLHLDSYLQKGDVLVFNNSKVLPARLRGQKLTGGKIEILLLKQLTENTWESLVKVKKNPVGLEFDLSKKGIKQTLGAKIIDRKNEVFVLEFNLKGPTLIDAIFKLGEPPTPPYIKRMAKDSEYQNIYAKKLGSVAAPTAGLHFTNRIFKKLKAKGVQIEFVTLHVGLGTFQPIQTKDIRKHKIHSEYFELDPKTANRLNLAKKQGRRIIAVGTTSVRVLETCAKTKCRPSRGLSMTFCVSAQKGNTDIYIYPGYKFKFIDAMITNFHLPESSLILLVSAFAGTKFIQNAYQHAIKKKYRFYSLGDAMFIK